MKKEILSLGRSLTRPELVAINGGNGTGTCFACTNVEMIPVNGPNVQAEQCTGDLLKNVSITEAKAHVSGGGSWCCDSCWAQTWVTPF